MTRKQAEEVTKANAENKRRESERSFIEKAKKRHIDEEGECLDDYSKVNYKRSHDKVIIICKIHGEYHQSPHHHLLGTRCPRCSGKNLSLDDLIKRSNEKYGNNKFNFNESKYDGETKPITIICPHGHKFETTPIVHLRKDGGCKTCRDNSTSDRLRYDNDEFIRLAKQKHGNLYSYDRCNYKDSLTKVIITCALHGDFEQVPASHLGGRGCPKCADMVRAEQKRYTAVDIEEAFINARKIHGNLYEYIRLFSNEGRLMIEMRCPTHGIILQRLDHHLHGHGCMSCVPQHSKQQLEWLQYCSISNPGIVHAGNSGEYKIPGTGFRADGFHSESNTIYEYQGYF
jgi:hypothetical protein